MTRQPWQDSAACAGMETELFYQPESMGRGDSNDRPDPHAAARATCARCPVITECLAWAIDTNQYGFLGGMTEMERAAEKRRRQRGQQRANNGGAFAVSPLEDARRMAVYERGLSDVEAAEELGLHRSTWRQWRIARRLNPHKPVRYAQALPARVDALRLSLHQSGLTDAEIAEGANCTVEAIKKWRYRRGLESNRERVAV